MPGTFPTISAGLAAASPGDTVLVACGTYPEINIALKSGVVVRSATGNATCTVVDGQFLGTVFVAMDVDSTARLEGFTIRRGDATTGAFFDNGGGGLQTTNASCTLRNCAFIDNRAKFGAGAGLLGGAPQFYNCTFDSNDATGVDWAAGGGVFCQDAVPVFLGCTFRENDAFAVDLPGDGGGIFSDSSYPRIEDCHFEGNDSGAGAGAFYSYDNDFASVSRCTFVGNTSAAGGAVYLETSYAGFVDCTFAQNIGANGGAAFLAMRGAPRFERCLFLENVATPFGGGAVDVFRAFPDFISCDFIDNAAGTVGGAVRLEGASQVEFDRILARGNTSGTQGGAFHVSGSTVAVMSRSTIHGNSGVQAGGVFVAGTATLSLASTILSGSSAGAGVACAGSGQVTLVQCDVFGNAGGDYVGCIAGQNGVLGNFSADPQYCNAALGQLGLTLPTSPCLPENTPSQSLVGSQGGSCGCPASATTFVPQDFATIGAALAASTGGDVVGVCSGTYNEILQLRDGVHVVGVRADLVRVQAPGPGASAVVLARGITSPTILSDLTVDAAGMRPHAVFAESLTTGLQLHRTRITGATNFGISNSVNSLLQLGGSLATANDVFGNGGSTPKNFLNLNVLADSLDVTLTFWGTTNYADVLASLQGKLRSCPITDSTHTKVLCAPLSALSASSLPRSAVQFSAAPNPFTKQTSLHLFLGGEVGFGELRIFDVRGRRVATLARGVFPAGPLEIDWDGRDETGSVVAPGVYFARFDSGNVPGASATLRLVHLR